MKRRFYKQSHTHTHRHAHTHAHSHTSKGDAGQMELVQGVLLEDEEMQSTTECMRLIGAYGISNVIHAAAFERIAGKHRKFAEQLGYEAAAEARKQARLRHDDKTKGVKHIGAKLDKAAAPPLRFVQLNDGSITSVPAKVDKAVCRAWQEIFRGNVQNVVGTVAEFVPKYRRFLFSVDEYLVGEISADMVWDIFQEINASSGGMDGWQPLELKMMSFSLCKWVAALLRLIEQGGAWPSSTRHARAAYLEKDGSKPGQVMPYRPLTIMAPLYRKWASLRPRSLDRWLMAWALPEMYAVAGQQGAADASYGVMLDVEQMTLAGTPYCGGAADIHKFFDQLLRQLVYAMLAMAGMPRGVLGAYKRFLEALLAYNVITVGLGHVHQRACGIPLGCPLSMMVVALLMRPWMIVAKVMGVEPKVLANDVFMLARGRRMIETFAKVLNATHEYLRDMGAKVAPAKSYNFSSHIAGRKWLQSTWWPHIQSTIDVVSDFRYLGTHFSTQVQRRHKTQVERLNKALAQLRKLQFVGASRSSKAKVIRTKFSRA